MTGALWIGLLFTLLAGILSGNCMLPMKFATRWPWEAVWLVFSVVSLLLLPWALALIEVRELIAVYASLRPTAFLAPVLFGAGWGVAQILFGLSITRLGLALGYAVIIGLGALLGTLVPLFIKSPNVVATSHGMLILAGVGVMMMGIFVSSQAGLLRERHSSAMKKTRSYGLALLLAVICGLMAPMVNYAFAFGQSIADQAVRLGTSRQSAGYAVWPVALLGGLTPNLAYSLWLLWKNKSARCFWESWNPDVWLGCLMGVLWMSAFAMYGVGSVYLGILGTSVGWALFQIFMIMTANLSGVLTGEWSEAPLAARRRSWTGIALLSLATGVIAAGNA